VTGTQDLSVYASFKYGTTAGGKRWFAAELPAPAWAKATRVSVNPKGQGRFLCREAKDYRNYLQQSVIVTPPPVTPWLRSEYVIVSMGFYYRFDMDAHGGGLCDDAVYAGLAVDDVECAALLTPRMRVVKKDERINFSGIEV
jgi:hypothetical protein